MFRRRFNIFSFNKMMISLRKSLKLPKFTWLDWNKLMLASFTMLNSLVTRSNSLLLDLRTDKMLSIRSKIRQFR
jgi:hypothetical protein